MQRLMHIMLTMRHCGLGHTAATRSSRRWRSSAETYERRLQSLDFEPAFDLDGALATRARRSPGRDDAGAHLAEE